MTLKMAAPVISAASGTHSDQLVLTDKLQAAAIREM